MDTNQIYKEVVTVAENVLNLAKAAKDKTIESDNLGKLMTTAILQDNEELSIKLNNLFKKDAVFHSLRKIKTMAGLVAVVLTMENKINYEIGKGDSKKFLYISLDEAKEGKWSESVKLSSVYTHLNNQQSGVTISDKQAFSVWCENNPKNPMANIDYKKALDIIPEETLQAMLQEGRAYKEESINTINAHKQVIDMFEAFKALPPQEAHSFLIQANAFLGLHEQAA